MGQKKKKRFSAEGKPKAAAVEEANPFDIRFHRSKHDVLGRKTKLQSRPLQSRAKAIEKRKKTLLVEYKHRRKNNVFLDKRFGEGDETLSVEEKMLQRFALSKQKYHERGGTYNCNLEEDELTHLGQSLSDIHNLTDQRPFMDSSDEEDFHSRMQSAQDVKDHHFGGFLTRKRPEDEGPARRLTQKEIMEERVARSKFAKAERQTERDKLNRQLDEVDAMWKQIQGQGLSRFEKDDKPQVEDYDIKSRELQFERRQAQAKNRLPTEEEKAKAELERLQKLESERLQRMEGLQAPAEGAEHFSADFLGGKANSGDGSRFTVRYDDGRLVQPDDPDNFVWQSGFRKTDEMSDSELSEEDTDEDDDDEEDISEGDEDEEEEEEDGSNEEEEDEEEEGMNVEKKLESLAAFELDEDEDEEGDEEEEDEEMEDGDESEDVVMAKKKKKLKDIRKEFMELLMQCDVDAEPNKLVDVNKLARPLFDLAQSNPTQTCECMQERLEEARAMFEQQRKKGHRSVCLPLSTIIHLQLVASIFPVTDFKHCVITPALLLMAESLTQWPVDSCRHILAGLYVCQLLFQYVRSAKRVVPEAVNFLTGILSLASTTELPSNHHLAPPFPASNEYHRLLILRKKHSRLPGPRPLEDIFSEDIIDDNDSDRLAALHTCLVLLEKFSDMYRVLPAHSELFAPAATHLKRMSTSKWHEDLKERHARLVEKLSEEPNPKMYMQVLKKRPVPLKLYEPKFDESYRIGKKTSRNKEQHESAKLKHKLKRELKGAAREIRKDNTFLMRHRLQEQIGRDKERKRKVNKLLHYLAEERHEAKMVRRKKK